MKKTSKITFHKIIFQCVYFSVPLIIILIIFIKSEMQESRSLNIILGSVAFILIQIYVLARIFKQKLKQENYDLIKIFREQINQSFGKFSEKRIRKRNQHKYYIPLDLNDPKQVQFQNRLFWPQNNNIFLKVINHLKNKQKVNYDQKSKQLNQKIILIEQRIKMTEEIYKYAKMMQQLNNNSYEKFLAKFKQSQKESFFTDTKKFQEKQKVDIISWKKLFSVYTYMQIRSKKNASQIKNLCISLLTKFADEICSNNQNKLKQFKKLMQDYNKTQIQVKNIQNDIKKQTRKMTQMNEQYEKLKKKHEFYQKQLSVQLNIRLTKLQLANLEVRLYNCRDQLLKKYQIVRNVYEQTFREIDDSYKITVFNNFKSMFNSFLNIQKSFIHTIAKECNKSNQTKLKTMNRQSLVYMEEQYHSIQHKDDLELINQKQRFKYIKLSKDNERRFLQKLFQEYINMEEVRINEINEKCEKYITKMVNFNKNFFEVKIIKYFKFLVSKQSETLKMYKNLVEELKPKIDQYKNFSKEKENEIVEIYRRIQNLTKEIYKIKRSDPNLEEECQSYKILLQRKINEYQKFSFNRQRYQQSILKNLNHSNEILSKQIQNQIIELDNFDIQFVNEQNEIEKKYLQYINCKNIIEKSSKETNHQDDIQFLNKLIQVFFLEWKQSEQFHHFVKKQIYIAINRKRPEFLKQLQISFIKLVKQSKQNLFQQIKTFDTEVFNFNLQAKINFQGSIKLTLLTQIKSSFLDKLKKLKIKIQVKKFATNIKICYTPLSLGKSWISIAKYPEIVMQMQIFMGDYDILRLPLLGKIIKKIVELGLIIKLHKVIIWPMRLSINIPVSLKDTRINAISQRINFQEEEQEKLQKNIQY